MQLNTDNIITTLRSVRHPSAGKDIVSLELVKNVEIDGNHVKFNLSFPTPNDPLKNSLKKASVRAIQAEFGQDVEVEVEILTDLKVASRTTEPEILPGVKNFIAVSSGKGGVGKSTVTVNLAVALAQQGYKVGLIDADIFGPSIPKMLDIESERPMATKINGKDYLLPVEKYGIKVLSLGLFVNPDDAMVWRGPMASNALKQLMTDAEWGALDYMLFDLPPGTSDIHLTLVQTLPVTGAVIVSTPQDVALADAIKGINMFRGEQINVPVLGLVENMAWFTPAELPENKYYIFGKEGCKKLAEKYNVPLLGQIPLVQSIREGGDEGTPSALQDSAVGLAFKDLSVKVVEQIHKRNEEKGPTKKVNITTHRR
ncbi:MAG: Mrp/NBP35 family ATP-binding protein [Bacteroidota bacterium]